MNEASMGKYREELKAMLGYIVGIDQVILNKAVNAGILKAKKDTPVEAAYLKDNWCASGVKRTGGGVECKLYNNAENAPGVNYGYRIKDSEGKTTGFAAGKFILEKAITTIEKALLQEFGKSVKEVKKKYDN